MTSESDDSGGLGWTLRSFVFEQAFQQLATSLRWMFWGLVLQLCGAALAVAPLAAALAHLAPLNAKIVLPGLLLLLVGGIVVLLGEQKCLHLKVPLGMTKSLPGHNWLRGAYWCHLASWLLRIARNVVGRGPVSFALLPLQLIGFVLLLLFLRKTADVLLRSDLRRLVDIIFAMAGGALVTGSLLACDVFLHLGILKLLPKPAALLLLVLPVILFFTTTGTYVVLLGRMASAARAFAKYLASIEAADSTDDACAVAADSAGPVN